MAHGQTPWHLQHHQGMWLWTQHSAQLQCSQFAVICQWTNCNGWCMMAPLEVLCYCGTNVKLAVELQVGPASMHHNFSHHCFKAWMFYEALDSDIPTKLVTSTSVSSSVSSCQVTFFTFFRTGDSVWSSFRRLLLQPAPLVMAIALVVVARRAAPIQKGLPHANVQIVGKANANW